MSSRLKPNLTDGKACIFRERSQTVDWLAIKGKEELREQLWINIKASSLYMSEPDKLAWVMVLLPSSEKVNVANLGMPCLGSLGSSLPPSI